MPVRRAAGRVGATRVALEEALAIRSLSAFVRHMWPELEPGTELDWNWHHQIICDALEEVTAGELKDLVICIPPGYMKSLLVSVMWPAWWWLQDPTKRFLTLSGADGVASRDSRKMRSLVRSPRYAALVERFSRMGGPEVWGLSKDKQEQVEFETTKAGSRLCMSTGGSVTGRRGDGMIIDDPHQVKDVLGATIDQRARALARAREKVNVALPSRVNHPKKAFRVLIMQRIGIGDVAEQALESCERSIVLPVEYDPDHPHACPGDPRTNRGELLHPARQDRDQVGALKVKMSLEHGPMHYEAQYNQRPRAAEGGMFTKRSFRRCYGDPRIVAETMDEIEISVDATFKGSAGSDHVSIQVWGRQGYHRFVLLEDSTEHRTFRETKSAIRTMSRKWPTHARINVEDKANGPAIMDDLMQEIPGVVPFNPDQFGSKEARASLAQAYVLSGAVEVVDGEVWTEDFLQECADFPGGAYDDRVDGMSQQLIRWKMAALTNPQTEAERMNAMFDMM